tara:strand:- start:1153 stop:1488 length:336 start_codon:yes stop_codon:yes gene_type:complete
MDELFKKKCTTGEVKKPPFDISEIHKYLNKVDGWELKSNMVKNHYLEKNFKFQNFIESQEFVNKVSSIAELEGHHPDIHFGWGYAKIKISTHAIEGLAENDFIIAAKIDQI